MDIVHSVNNVSGFSNGFANQYFCSIGNGWSSCSGQYLGQKNRENAGKAANQLTKFAMVFSIGIMIVIYVMRPLIFNYLFGAITTVSKLSSV